MMMEGSVYSLASFLSTAVYEGMKTKRGYNGSEAFCGYLFICIETFCVCL
jgi:hypothetical protein